MANLKKITNCCGWNAPKRSVLPDERKLRQGGLMLAASRVRSKKKSRKTTRNLAAPKAHLEPTKARDDLETACDETRPTR